MKHRLSLAIWLMLLLPGGMARAETPVESGQIPVTENATAGLPRVAQAQPAQSPDRKSVV